MNTFQCSLGTVSVLCFERQSQALLALACMFAQACMPWICEGGEQILHEIFTFSVAARRGDTTFEFRFYKECSWPACHFDLVEFWFIKMTPVGFEPTPFRNGALSHRLRPLGQSVRGTAKCISFLQCIVRALMLWYCHGAWFTGCSLVWNVWFEKICKQPGW